MPTPEQIQFLMNQGQLQPQTGNALMGMNAPSAAPAPAQVATVQPIALPSNNGISADNIHTFMDPSSFSTPGVRAVDDGNDNNYKEMGKGLGGAMKKGFGSGSGINNQADTSGLALQNTGDASTFGAANGLNMPGQGGL